MTLEIQTARHAFASHGWLKLQWDAGTAAWAEAALSAAREAVAAPENAHWLQCQGTWFVGVDALPNDAAGRINGADFPTAVTSGLSMLGLPKLAFHPAQVSVTYPGYPQARAGESESAARYRRNRDAAHVDGLLPVGPDRRRMLREPHAYILGLPLSETSPDASPLVVWEGSHIIMQRAFRAAFAGVPVADWAEVDVTEAYQAARRKVFDTCSRILLPARPGEATIVHRLALHGVAPWPDHVSAGKDGRMIAYLRPQDRNETWVSAP